MVKSCLERVPAALLSCGRIGVYLGKMAIWAHSLRCSFHCLPLLPCAFVLTLGLTRPLFRCFGRRRTRDRDFFHLKMVVERPVNEHQLEASDAFCARLSSSALRRSVAHPASAVFGGGRRSLSRALCFRSTLLCMHMDVALRSALYVGPGACTSAVHIIYIIHCT